MARRGTGLPALTHATATGLHSGLWTAAATVNSKRACLCLAIKLATFVNIRVIESGDTVLGTSQPRLTLLRRRSFLLCRKSMFCCCAARPPAPPTAAEEITALLHQFVAVFPQTYFACVVSKAGDVLSVVNSEAHNTDQLLQQVAALKRSAVQLAHVFSVDDSSIIRLKGATNMLTCKKFDEHFLVFVTRMSEKRLEGVDLHANDEQLRQLVTLMHPHVRDLVALVYEST